MQNVSNDHHNGEITRSSQIIHSFYFDLKMKEVDGFKILCTYFRKFVTDKMCTRVNILIFSFKTCYYI